MALPQGFTLETPIETAPPRMALPQGFVLEQPAPSQYGSAVPQVNAQGQVIRQPDAIPQARAPSRGVMDYIAGIPETAVTAGFGMLKGAVAPFAAVAGEYLGGVNTPQGRAQGARFGKNVEAALTYTPQTQTAQDIINYAGEKLQGVDFNAIPFAQGSTVAALAPAAARQLPSAIKNEANYLKGVVGEIPSVKAAREKTAVKNIANSYENAQRIEAAQIGDKYGLLMDPEVSNPTTGAKVRGAIVGERNISNQMAEKNQLAITAKLKEEVGIPSTKKLDETTFNEAHAAPELTQPYEKVKAIPSVQIGANTLDDLESIKRGALIGEKSSDTLHISQRLDNLIEDVRAGGDGNRFLSSVQQLRKEAQDIYRKKDPLTPLERREADAIMKAADILEGVLTDNLPFTKDRDAFLKARTGHAKLYQLEEATDLATGVTDPRVFAKMINDKKPITGVARDMGLFAANFPDFVAPTGKGGWTFPRFTRASALPMLGSVIGGTLGNLPGAAVGMALGSAVSEIGKRAIAKNMLTPGFQAKNAIPTDYRPTPFQTNNLRPSESRSLAVLPSAPRNDPNFVIPETESFRGPFDANRPDARQPMMQGQPAPTNALRLGLDEAPEVTARLRAEDARRMRMAQMAEAEGLAAEASGRAPTRGGTLFDLDPISGNLTPVSQGIKGATPETFQNYMSTLGSAVDKVTSKQNFNLTAAEKVAFDKTKFYIAEVSPGFEKLSDKAIVSRMMDRKWVEDAVVKAREKSASFYELAVRSRSPEMMNARASAAQNAELARQAEEASGQMKTTLDLLEDQLVKLRADTSGKRQGPKTQGAIRNNLTANQNRNKLRED